MKIKTSVTLSEDVLRELDRLVDKHRDRSELIEVALREYLAGRAMGPCYERAGACEKISLLCPPSPRRSDD
ncbi:MAG: ribbon-helix-helix domain-containing protein [Pseudomonadota bacterium]